MTDPYSWTASESESIEPFAVSATGLDACKWRLNRDENFSTADVREVEDFVEFWDSFAPELLIEFVEDNLCAAIGLASVDAVLSVIVRDRELNKFVMVDQWPLVDVPTVPVDLSSCLDLFSRSQRLDICLQVSPAISKEREPGIAANRIDVVARKVFRVRSLTQGAKFPHRWVKPEEMVAKGVRGNTVWLVHWKGEDLERPPSETLEVWLNEDHREVFKILPLGGKAGRLVQHEIGAAVLGDIAVAVLRADQEPNEKTGTTQVVTDLLAEVSGQGYEAMQARSRRLDGPTVIRAWAQSKIGVSDRFSDLDFIGR